MCPSSTLATALPPSSRMSLEQEKKERPQTIMVCSRVFWPKHMPMWVLTCVIPPSETSCNAKFCAISSLYYDSCTKSGLTDRATSPVSPLAVRSGELTMMSVRLRNGLVHACLFLNPKPRESSRAPSYIPGGATPSPYARRTRRSRSHQRCRPSHVTRPPIYLMNCSSVDLCSGILAAAAAEGFSF